METIHLSSLEAHLAASLLAGCAHLDPCGMATEADTEAMTAAGQCFAATSDKGQAVYVLKVKNGVAWVSAVKGSGPTPWRDVLLPVIEAQAKGCAAVAFQTARRGVVKSAVAQGYEITGWILKKRLQ